VVFSTPRLYVAESMTVIEERGFRAVLGHFATGIAVVTAMVDHSTPVGMTVQSFCSLSLEPPLILICPGLGSTTWPRIQLEGKLCVNLLSQSQEPLARQFAKSGGDKFQGVQWAPSPISHAPILEGGLAWIDCQIDHSVPGGDHLIVVCQVLDLCARTDLRPLIFFKSGFERML
jgi:flavin reductase (DIM6/NTAB) family NADH-FMN oxidoreductase RutF